MLKTHKDMKDPSVVTMGIILAFSSVALTKQ